MIIYLDNAATTFPKPQSVYDEVIYCMRECGGNSGRGAHSLSLAAAKKIFDCRGALADFFGVSELERVIFTLNTTQSLNMAIKGLLKKGDHVIISDLEHNAVYRPIFKLAEQGIIEYDIFSSMVNAPRRSPTLICAKIAALLRPNTKMVICTHASNICSAIMPIRAIGEFCRKRGIFFVVDAAQSAGHYPIDVDGMNISALCMPAHKGLYGPQGCGVLMLGKNIYLETLIEGGNGVASLEGNMSEDSPERYEAGTLPAPIISGLCKGIDCISSIGEESICAHESALFRYAKEELCNIDRVSIYAPSYAGSTLLFNISDIPSDITAQELNSYGICVRGGFHCSALGHKTLGTHKEGAVRISFGIFNKQSDIDALASALSKIVK